MKKLSIFLLALVASAGITQAAIVDGSCGDNLTWSLNTKDSTLTITGSGEMTSHPWSDYDSYIKYVSLPDGLTSIGNSAFHVCYRLTSVTIPNSVTSIGSSAFQSCSGLTSVTIGNSVTSIGNYAFYECSGLTSVTIPNSVTSIGDYAFYECYRLTSVTIPNSVTSIGDQAFRNCSSLTSVTIPNSVTSIGGLAFWNCSGLTSLSIGNSITSIGSSPFYGCSITTLTVLATTPPSGGSACGINAGNCTLYVPTESVNTYANTIWWEDFKEIKPLGDLICVQFKDWDGSLIARCYIEEGASAIAPANPTREGYTFIGWDKEFSNVTEDLVVTALYEAGENTTYTLLFQNGIDEAEITHESITFMLPVAPSITGFTFLKWVVVGGDLIDTITIQAVYQANTPTNAPAVYTNPANPAQKLIKNGNVYILADDKMYTIQGQQVK